jgi:putative inorganic carbon (hco3(-)) transporter
MTGPEATTMPDRHASGPQYPPIVVPMFAVFLAFVVARYIGINDRLDILSTIRFEFLLGLSAIIMSIIKMSSRTPDFGAARPLLYSIIILFLLTAVQVPFAADQVMARMVFNDRVFKFAMLTFLMAVMIESPRSLILFMAAYLFSVFYVTEESVEGLISGSLYWENQGVMRLHGAVPMYGHPNSLGGVAMGSLPFIWFLFLRIKSRLARIGMLMTAATSIICVIYSGSRTAYMGLIALLLWIWFQSTRKVKFGIILAVTMVVLVPVLPDQYLQRFKSIGGHEAEGRSKEARIEILEDAIVIFKEHPFGVGVSSFPLVRTQRFGRSQDTHNLYLEVATNLGIQGLIAFVVFIVILMITFRRAAFAFRRQRTRLRRAVVAAEVPAALRRRAARHDSDLRLLLATAQAGAGFVVVRLVLGLFGMDYYEIYWWFSAGLAFVLSSLVVTTQRITQAFETALRAPVASRE